MIRGLAYWFFGGIVTFLFFFFVLITSPFARNATEYVHRLVRLWSSVLLRGLCGVRIKATGLEQIDPNTSYIVVSNHRSFTDILIGNSTMPLQFRWLAKKSLFRIPLIGYGMKRAGYISIEREKSISSLRSLEKVREQLVSGKSVWIFPEGTRTPKDVLGRFKRGAFVLAQDTGFPILPVVIAGSDRLFPRPWKIRRAEVTVDVLNPISADVAIGENKGKSLVRLIDTVRKIIQADYDARVAHNQR
jgi:1-acyl-sn-glycerol-3-phosphate acyltransferase